LQNLSDFRGSGCLEPTSYIFLWMMLFVSLACYVIDLITCYNLLVWSRFGLIKPPSPWNQPDIPKWVFTGCIILSWILLAYRWWKAVRAMKSNVVAKSYLDPLAVRVQSIRMGKRGRGWRRFLVFAELTKSKHGTEYIALFVYFAFEASVRILLAEGPRNVVNGYTIYTMAHQWAESPYGDKSQSAMSHFWQAAMSMADQSYMSAAIFIGMLFTCIVWLFAFIGLCIACLLWVIFLWHHIPSQDGGLRAYCKRKVDKSVEKIVSVKIKKALDAEAKGGFKPQGKSGKDALTTAPADLKRQPTLPVLNDGDENEAMLLGMNGAPSLPPYESRPGTPLGGPSMARGPILPGFEPSPFARPGAPQRSATDASSRSYGSDAPLLDSAGDIGFGGQGPGRSYSPAPGARSFTPSQERSRSPAPGRFAGPGSMRSQSPGPGQMPGRSFTPAGPPPGVSAYRTPSAGQPGMTGPPRRADTGLSSFSGWDGSQAGRASPGPDQLRQLTPTSNPQGSTGPGMGQMRSFTPAGAPPPARSFTPAGPPPGGRFTPGPQSSQSPSAYGARAPSAMSGRQTPGYPGNFEMQSRWTPGPGSGSGSRSGPPPPVRSYSNGPPASQGPGQVSYAAYNPGNVASPTMPGTARPLMGGPGMGIPRVGTAPAAMAMEGLAPPGGGDDVYRDSVLDAYGDGQESGDSHAHGGGYGGASAHHAF